MNLTIIITGISFTIIFLISMYLAGVASSGLFKISLRNYEYVSFGFITTLGLVELFGWFFIAYRLPAMGFDCILFSTLIILIVLGVKFIKKENIMIPKLSFTKIISIGMTILLIVLTQIYYRSDADDSFYVSNVALFKHSEYLNAYDSSFGIESLGTVPMYDFQTWEAFMAVFCRVFHLDATSMMHTICIPVLLILSASSFLFLGRVLLEDDDKKAELFYIGVSVFHLFGGYAVYSEGSFLLSRLWQGKAVYLNVVIPVLIALMLKNVKRQSKVFFLQMLLCVLAGVALNPTSMYVMGFLIVFMMLVISITERKAKNLLHIIPSAITIVFFTAMIYLRTHNFDGQIDAASSTNETFVKDVFTYFMGEGKLYIVFFLISVAIIAMLGNIYTKIYLIWTPIVLFMTIWNPWIGRIVAENITMTPSYWRVFWLLPLGPAIVTAFVLLYERTKTHRIIQICLMGIALIALAVPGKWMFTYDNGFNYSNNIQKVPEETLIFGQYIVNKEKRAVVLAVDELSTTFRQQYVDLELVYSRPQYIWDLFLYRGEEEQSDERTYLMNVVNGRVEDLSNMNALIEKYGIDFIVVNNDNTLVNDYLNANTWEIILQSDKYTLYQ